VSRGRGGAWEGGREEESSVGWEMGWVWRGAEGGGWRGEGGWGVVRGGEGGEGGWWRGRGAVEGRRRGVGGYWGGGGVRVYEILTRTTGIVASGQWPEGKAMVERAPDPVNPIRAFIRLSF